MRKITSLFAASLFLVSGVHGALITLSTTFDNNMLGGTPRDPVGVGYFTYEASSALASGSYAFNSFTNPTFTATFDGGYVFTLANLNLTETDINALHVDIGGNQFNFTTTLEDPAYTAVFENSQHNWLTFGNTQPLQDLGAYNGHGYYAMEAVQGMETPTYSGGYGIGSAAAPGPEPAPVPEPGTWAAAAMLLGGAGFARWRKRAKRA